MTYMRIFKQMFEKKGFKQINQNKSTRCQWVTNKITVLKKSTFENSYQGNRVEKCATENWNDEFFETNAKIKKCVWTCKQIIVYVAINKRISCIIYM